MARGKEPSITETHKGPANSAGSASDRERSITDLNTGSGQGGAYWCPPTLYQGWVSVAVWMTFGLLLEGLLAYKTPAYLQDDERRQMFRLAHTHGTTLGLVLIAAAVCGQRFRLFPSRSATVALRLGAGLMPVGFLLAGVWHYESDPGLAIWLIPPSAVLVIFGVVALALASRLNFKGEEG